ncbi:MAG TPA: isochorismatase family protein [Rhizomicrobium sp.]|jgi:nicotinamidase-related amidase|nr:isochorismatase family protein [Rhizomicrobium sp.]
MPVTPLDPKTALIVIDLQKGVPAVALESFGAIVERTVELARAFRQRGLPVVLVNVTGAAPGRTDAGPFTLPTSPDWADLVPELEQQPSDLTITKQRVGAFLGTSLDSDLRERGVTQIVLTGVATGRGVEATARSAHDLGYNITFAVDAMTDRDPDTHRYWVERIFPSIGETGTTGDIIALLNCEARA